MATGWQKSFKASARYNRKIALEGNLRQAIIDGAVIRSDDIKHIATVYEMSQKRVRQIFQQVEERRIIGEQHGQATTTS
jgi:adenylosuccinate lyase